MMLEESGTRGLREIFAGLYMPLSDSASAKPNINTSAGTLNWFSLLDFPPLRHFHSGT